MSSLANPTSIPHIAHGDGKDTERSITMVSSLGAWPRLDDTQGHQVLSLMKSVDTKDTPPGRIPIRHCMLATAVSTDMLNLGSERRSASTASSGEAFQRSSLSRSGDEQLAIRAPLARKASHKLQLPSFDNLGIASPHPDYLCTRPHLSEPIDQPRTHTCGQDSSRLGLHDFTKLSSKNHLRPNQVSSSLLTPPDDSGTIGWNPSAITFTDTVKTTPFTDLKNMTTQQDVVVSATNPDAGEGNLPSDLRDNCHGNEKAGESGDPAPPNSDEGDTICPSLLEQAIGITG